MIPIILIFASTSLFSFYLGYAAHAEGAEASPVLINCPQNAYVQGSLSTLQGGGGKEADNGAVASASGAYVASKNGSKYYPVDCSGAKRIKDANKVWFETPAAAEGAGYALAQGC